MKNIKIYKQKNIQFQGDEYYIGFDIKKKSKLTLIKIILGSLIGFVNGFFGGGGGMICVPLLTNVLKLPTKNAHATTLFIMLPLSLISLIIYMISGNLQIDYAVDVSLGFIVGGVLGAILLKKINNIWIEIIFSIIMILGGIKLII